MSHYPMGAVTIKEETTETGGHFGCETMDMAVPNTVGWHEFDHTFPVPVSLLNAQMLIGSDNVGDKLQCHIAPDSVVGTLSAQMDSGDKTAAFAVPVVDGVVKVFVGMYIDIDGNDLGRVTSVADDLLSVETEIAAPSNIALGKVVKVTVKMSPNCKLSSTGRFTIGEGKIGGSYISAGTTVRICYYNEVTTAKDFSVLLEYLY